MFQPVPHALSILVGEIIYNLRAAIDYLIYELAFVDSKKIQHGTQFPIEDTEGDVMGRCDEKRRRGVFLRGLTDQHRAAIKRLQPCDGCN